METNRRKFIRITSAALSTIGFGTVTAKSSEKSAKELVEQIEDSEDPEKAFDELSDRQQKKVIEYLKISDSHLELTEPSDGGLKTQSVGGSKEVTAKWIGVNGSGEELYRYTLEVEWDYDGNEVSNTNYRRYPDTDSILWEFLGHVGKDTTGGDGSSSYEVYTQGEFGLCASGRFGCVQNTYPWVEVQVEADGSYSTDSNEGSQL